MTDIREILKKQISELFKLLEDLLASENYYDALNLSKALEEYLDIINRYY